MLTIAVNGRAVVVPQEFEDALARYASANFKQGVTKVNNAGTLPELRRQERQAWIDLYDALATMMTNHSDEVARRVRANRVNT